MEINTKEFVRVCYTALRETYFAENDQTQKKKKKKRRKKNYSEQGEILLQKMIKNNLEKADWLEPENDEGDTEYKLKLLDASISTLTHRTTQMKFRIKEGGGICYYMIGFEDGGRPIGLVQKEMTISLEVLGYLARKNEADLIVRSAKRGEDGLVMETEIRKKLRPNQKLSFRVLMFGTSGSGKSTLISVLLTKKLDNGKGLARMRIFKHKHEIMTGKTSSVLSVDLPKDSPGLKTVSGNARIRQLCLNSQRSNVSESENLITLIDTGGHSKYQNTFLDAFMTLNPNYFFLVQSGLEVNNDFIHRLEVSVAFARQFGIVVTHADELNEKERVKIIQRVNNINDSNITCHTNYYLL